MAIDDKMDPAVSRIFREDGSLAYPGNNFNKNNRKRGICLSQDEVKLGNSYGVGVDFSLAGGTSATLVYEIPDKEIFVPYRKVTAFDEGSSGVNLEINAFEGGALNTAGNELPVQNSHRNSDKTSSMVVYGETTDFDLSEANKLWLPSGRMVSDKKLSKDDFY